MKYVVAGLLVCSALVAGVSADMLMYLPFDTSMDDAVHSEAPSQIKGNSLGTPETPAPSIVTTGGLKSGGGDGGALNYLDAAPAMGSGYGGWIRYGTPEAGVDTPLEASLNSLESFTIMGWFNTKDDNVYGDGGARLFNRNGGIAVLIDDGRLKANIDGDWVTAGEYWWGSKNTWVFWAVSYDGTVATDNVKFYRGYTNWDDAELVSTHSLDNGTVTGGNGTPLVVGNNYYSETGAIRPFDGYLDEMRIFGSQTDATGALGLNDISGYMLDAIVPEPATMLLLGCGGMALVRIKKRR